MGCRPVVECGIIVGGGIFLPAAIEQGIRRFDAETHVFGIVSGVALLGALHGCMSIFRRRLGRFQYHYRNCRATRRFHFLRLPRFLRVQAIDLSSEAQNVRVYALLIRNLSTAMRCSIGSWLLSIPGVLLDPGWNPRLFRYVLAVGSRLFYNYVFVIFEH